ncbi:hypothetical protein COUCH_18115 [Couchioplanes caeruleus]|uniref:hypothetical protein n=1 Tax=Couchioplanes caeruleus TaxID=56438 RepID=UPI0020BDA179|nr:hypothetical protein [Couchioplanes caeruleus]UQU68078.1 hypothetical protein COUCH_18115 [Couchioplanes caeruleus]
MGRAVAVRPCVIGAAALSAAATAFLVIGARVVQRQADAHGIVVGAYAPDRTGLCEHHVSCLPAGTATTVAQGLALVAAFVPVLVGLVLGVPLTARRTVLARTLAAGAVCTAVVAVTFRLVAARYALVVDGPGHGLLRELHKNSVTFMVMQTVFVIALAHLLRRAGSRALPTLAVSVVAWPAAIVVAQVGGLLLGMLAYLLTSWSDGLSAMLGTQTEDETAAFATLALAGCTAVTVITGRRTTR